MLENPSPADSMNSNCHQRKWSRSIASWGCVLAAGMVLAEVPDREVPRPEQGKIGASGKFTPNYPFSNAQNAPTLPKDLETFAKSLVKPLGGGRLAIGRVTLDTKARTVSVPAQVNQTDGLVEYALVTTGGKVHEALLATDASPSHLHLAMLLLDLVPKGSSNSPVELRVDLEWQGNGPVRRLALEDLIVRGRDSEEGRRGSTLNCPAWHYGGSSIFNGRLASEMEGSIISLIMDPAALINAPRRLPVDDRLLLANTPKMPPKGMPVTLHFRSVPKPPATPVPTTVEQQSPR